MRAEEKLFERIDKGLSDFFASNPTREDIEKARKYFSEMALNRDYISMIELVVASYVLERLGESHDYQV